MVRPSESTGYGRSTMPLELTPVCFEVHSPRCSSFLNDSGHRDLRGAGHRSLFLSNPMEIGLKWLCTTGSVVPKPPGPRKSTHEQGKWYGRYAAVLPLGWEPRGSVRSRHVPRLKKVNRKCTGSGAVRCRSPEQRGVNDISVVDAGLQMHRQRRKRGIGLEIVHSTSVAPASTRNRSILSAISTWPTWSRPSEWEHERERSLSRSQGVPCFTGSAHYLLMF